MKIDARASQSPAMLPSATDRRFSRKLLPALIASCFACGPVYANPTGAQVVNGQVTITNNGAVLTITNSPGSIINWSSFSISPGELTQFLQQNSSSSVLNRIVGQDPSQIFGALQSNGKVFLINPNGILFGANSKVNVGALTASTLNISDADFIAGKLNFSAAAGSEPGSVVNQGSITTPAGGQVYLIAPQVQNNGIITSPQGEVLLAAGHSVQLVDGGDPNLQVVISAPTDQALNLGNVVAQGGKIGIYGALVNQSGIVSADSAVVGQDGKVVFKSSQVTTLSGDSVTSANGAGNGGTVYVLGPQVTLTDNAQIQANGQTGGGTVYVGGAFHGADSNVVNSSRTYIGVDTSISANAIQNGTGGNIAVWSDIATYMYGSIYAKGGAQGGDGGYVETSGKNYLDFRGRADLTAAKGTTGNLLLDPYTVTIDDTGSAAITPTGTNPISYTSGANSDVTAASINSQLATANVIIQAGAGGGGDVTVASNNINWISTNTLTLAASANVNINGTIQGQSGTLELIATNGNVTQTAAVNVANLSAKASGDVTLTNTGNVVGTLAGSAGGTNGFAFSTNDNVTVGSVAGNQGTVVGITASGTGGVTLNAAARFLLPAQASQDRRYRSLQARVSARSSVPCRQRWAR